MKGTTAGNKAVTLADIELQADALDVRRAASIYDEHGCLVVRGLMREYASAIRDEILRSMAIAVDLLEQGRGTEVPEGLTTPDGTLFIKAPESFSRPWQVMVTSCRYTTSSTFFRSATDPALVGIAREILGENVELFMNGQCLCKEPAGGHPKLLHQDASYFEHKYEGPVAVLTYAVPTTIERGALHVVPGSHRFELLEHVDTESHLGLDPNTWTFDAALPVEGEPGDAIFFHVKTIHGSPPNYSTEPRPVFIHRYRRADDYVVISATTVANRETRAKQVEAAKKENQFGFMVSGFRTYETRD
jgi:phytanoyl-CoA hydroxylase